MGAAGFLRFRFFRFAAKRRGHDLWRFFVCGRFFRFAVKRRGHDLMAFFRVWSMAFFLILTMVKHRQDFSCPRSHPWCFGDAVEEKLVFLGHSYLVGVGTRSCRRLSQGRAAYCTPRSVKP